MDKVKIVLSILLLLHAGRLFIEGRKNGRYVRVINNWFMTAAWFSLLFFKNTDKNICSWILMYSALIYTMAYLSYGTSLYNEHKKIFVIAVLVLAVLVTLSSWLV